VEYYVDLEFFIFLILEVRIAAFVDTAGKVYLNIYFEFRPIVILFS
jgi:hypothetical protein